jgi:ribose transport system permease protein
VSQEEQLQGDPHGQAPRAETPADAVTPSPPQPVTPSASRAVNDTVRGAIRYMATGPVLGLVTVLTVFVVLLAWRGEPGSLRIFLGKENLQVLVYAVTPKAVLALGMLLIIISGGIDLSVGSVVALVTVVTMVGYRFAYGLTGSEVESSFYAVFIGTGVGGVCGLANGLVVTRLKVGPFVATLGLMSVARGLAYWLADRKSVSFGGNPRPEWLDQMPGFLHLDELVWFDHAPKPDWVEFLATAIPKEGLFNLDSWSFGWFNLGSWSVAPLAVVVALLLWATVLGRYTYAIGSNEATARLCGVSINRTKVIIYTLAGLLTGWAGVLSFTQVGGQPGGSVGLELEVIAAVVIGGASLSGGQGGVGGVLVGVLILGILNNGVSQFSLPVEIKYILIGAIIIMNSALGRWRQRG